MTTAHQQHEKTEQANSLYSSAIRFIKEKLNASGVDGFLSKKNGGFYNEGKNVDLVQEFIEFYSNDYLKFITIATIPELYPASRREVYEVIIRRIEEGENHYSEFSKIEGDYIIQVSKI